MKKRAKKKLPKKIECLRYGCIVAQADGWEESVGKHTACSYCDLFARLNSKRG